MEYNRIFQDDFVSFDTVIEGTPLASMTAEKTLEVFNQLGIIDTEPYSNDDEIPVADLQQFIDLFDDSQDLEKQEALAALAENVSPSARQGIGAFSTVSYARWFLSRFATEELTLRRIGGKIVAVNGDLKPTIKGKVSDYIFIADDDKKTGKGHLSVDVTQEFFKNRTKISVFHHWDIEVFKYTVHQRVDAGFSDFPFPVLQGNPELRDEPTEEVLVEFPEEALNPEKKSSVWFRGLDHKLFARGEGSMVIHNIYQSVNGSELRRLDDNHRWYAVDDKSCVDLMFKGYPPAVGLPPQSNYCLGRCKHPKIVNTCGD